FDSPSATPSSKPFSEGEPMPKSDDAMDKISKLIEDRINAAFEGREQKDREEKDPGAKLEGIVNRAIDKRFAELGEEKPKDKPAKKDEGGDEKILGGIFG